MSSLKSLIFLLNFPELNDTLIGIFQNLEQRNLLEKLLI